MSQVSPTPIIALTNVTKQFPVGNEFYPALRGISLEIFPEDFTIIHGPSGSGKSTLLNILTGLELPTEGKVFLGGKRIDTLAEDDRGAIRNHYLGTVHQQPIWIKSLTVWENVALPLLIAGCQATTARDRALRALGEVGMGRYAKHRPTEISGGQQQRVSLARAIIHNPRVLVLDEPTGNLDTHAADQVLQLLQELNKHHRRTIVMVTHNLIYLPFANRTIEVQDGLIKQQVKETIKPIPSKPAKQAVNADSKKISSATHLKKDS